MKRVTRTAPAATLLALVFAACGQDVAEPTTIGTDETIPTTTAAEAVSEQTSAPEETTPTQETVPPEDTALTLTGRGEAIPLRTPGSSQSLDLPQTESISTSAAGTIAVASARGSIRFFNDSGAFLFAADDAEESAIRGVVFLGDTESIVAGGTDGAITLWTRSGDEWAATDSWSAPGSRSVDQLAAHPNGQFVATVHSDGVTRLWDLSTGTPPELSAELGPVLGTITSLAVGGADSSLVDLMVVAGTSRGAVYSSEGGAALAERSSSTDPITGVGLAPDSSHVATSGGTRPSWIDLANNTGGLLESLPESGSQTSAIAVWGDPAGGDVLIAVGGSEQVGANPAPGDSQAGSSPIAPAIGNVRIVTSAADSPAIPFDGIEKGVVALTFTRDGSGFVVAGPTSVVYVPLVFG